MNQKNIGSFLKILRKEKNLTQEQLAEQFNVSSRTVSRWETGSNMPDLSLLVELADYAENEKGILLKRLRIISIVGLCSIIVWERKITCLFMIILWELRSDWLWVH